MTTTLHASLAPASPLLRRLRAALPLLLMAFAPLALAEEATLDTGVTAWMMTATLLVLCMCLPGLALFYGGLVRAKNMLSLFSQCFAIAGVIGVLWVLYGYSLVIDTSGMVEGEFSFNSFVGGLDRAMLAGLNGDSLVLGMPEGVFITFQMTFAIITPALIAGAFAERMKFVAALLFMALWFTFVYAPMAHMVWGGPGALMHNWGVLDFAGGTAVHINAGVAALAACLLLGKRKGYPHEIRPHNLPLAMTGAALLWVGWFGFNVGSAAGVGGISGITMLNTQLGACAGIVGWMLVELLKTGRPSALGLASGAIAGLVGITPACAYVGPGGALAIGLLSGVLCYLAVTSLKQRLGYDDSLDVFGLHGVGGVVGAILTGVFCVPELGGYVEGREIIPQVWAQLKSVLFTFVYCFAVSWVLLKLVDKLVGLRVDEQAEDIGLDLAEHNETAYNH
ncbi:MAG: ammonium transporter [Pseudomonas sp.]|jgi:Amt family ammonium transporter|nr:ammonium transporter [Pseudomonadales bacterium]MAK85558.1 ammonium transporter [Pseudomonas sp.]MBD3877688.1 ammonium transporter [Stutzerimonas kunmingensis]HCH75091.1 ammonium transporter [Pseudomonas sp.]|tara:strand:+ start:1810 stop:3162 length:1353 start_codon:yes stop_codon:yes gene_type:complete